MSSDNKDLNSLPVTVQKLIPVSYDLGNLTVFDSNVLDRNDLDSSNSKREEHIKSTTRDNVQLLIGQILSLPIKTTTEGNATNGQSSSITLIKLPEPISELPREKPLPKPKAPTKWELFAAKKNIKPKAKSGKMVFDDATGEWVPKWGYKGINKKLDDQWLVEVDDKNKGTENELVDPRSLDRAERKKLIKKHQLQQKRNL
ncbi:HBL013Cp [Eremothecium sinecaudum]|uniref:Ribosome biogenesis regulatory protein n=1 Tax=Eremothecium sinecaudum TaxID=45286 RepID=A0A120K105_9SACH|nr:HBL013Cp [Eremothecium sinecaudum]AMD18889.1 HBL013Cp [Eremothecium sinecaudum]